MINNLNQILLFLSVTVIFVVAMTFIVRTIIKDWRIRKVRPTINHVYTEGEYKSSLTVDDNEDMIRTRSKVTYDHELITDVCQFCNQVDHIHINNRYTQRLIDYNHKNIGIGEYMVSHNGHRIIHYINIDSEYVSSRIPPVDLHRLENRLTDELTVVGV